MWHNKCGSRSPVEIFSIHILLFLPGRVEVEPGMAETYLFHPFNGAKPRLSRQGGNRRSGWTSSKPQPLGEGVEWFTSLFDFCCLFCSSPISCLSCLSRVSRLCWMNQTNQINQTSVNFQQRLSGAGSSSPYYDRKTLKRIEEVSSRLKNNDLKLKTVGNVFIEQDAWRWVHGFELICWELPDENIFGPLCL